MATKTTTRKQRPRSSRPTAKKTRGRGVFSVRFSSDEIEILRIEASACGKTLTGLVRDVVIHAVNQTRSNSGAVVILGEHTAQPNIVTVSGDLATRVLTAA
jgi:hypothetical protein